MTNKYIYDRHEHNLVLLELGLLDDDDDWNLYLLQESRYDDIDVDTWFKYVLPI